MSAATGPFPHHVNGHLVGAGLPSQGSFGGGAAANVVGYSMGAAGMPSMNGMMNPAQFGGYAAATTPAIPSQPPQQSNIPPGGAPSSAFGAVASSSSSSMMQTPASNTTTPYSAAPSATSMMTGGSVPMSAPIRAPQTGSENKREGVSSFLVCGTRFDVDSKYKLIKPIGHGAYGVVCSAEDVQTKKKVAIKKITKAFENLIETKRTLREVKLLRHFRHNNIIPVYDIMKPESFEKFEDVYIVSELMNTDLHQIISSSQTLTDEHVQYFLYQILRGLKYIHSANVLHRDLKPSNLLLNANCDLKICDFGLARVSDQKGFLTEYVATRWYRAPEIMLSWKEYTKAIDVWSVGCILGEILGRKPLFPGKDYLHQLHLIMETLGTPSWEDTEYIASPKAKGYVRGLPPRPKVPFRVRLPHASPLALDLLERMLTFAPEKRITVEEALAHPYLKMLHDPNDEPSAPSAFDPGFEGIKPTKENLKALLWREACEVHPELRALHSVPDDFERTAERERALPGDDGSEAGEMDTSGIAD